MKKYLATVALAATLAQPATAVTFPSLTTIYVGSGVSDNGGDTEVGIATVFTCSNVSGVSAQVRFLVLGPGGVQANHTMTLVHGATISLGTHQTTSLSEDVDLLTGVVNQGVINIEATQSGVFCTAVVLDAADAGDGYTLPLVRVNPHPGTVE